jgi:hypothetical protein
LNVWGRSGVESIKSTTEEDTMRRMTWILAAVILLCTQAAPAFARSSDSVGLGISLGAAFPDGEVDRDKFAVRDWQASFNWGFYVNIPLISTFHITPSAELYKVGDQHATDISLAFKFIVPVWRLDLYIGVVPGLTAVNDVYAPNVGGLAGLSFNLFANLDLFFQAKYKVLFHGDRNTRVLHGNAGFLFTF